VIQDLHARVAELGGQAAYPVVPLDLYFEGNEDPASFAPNLDAHPSIARIHAVLREIEQRSDVSTVVVQIDEVLDPPEWPYAPAVYVITSSDAAGSIAGQLRSNRMSCRRIPKTTTAGSITRTGIERPRRPGRQTCPTGTGQSSFSGTERTEPVCRPGLCRRRRGGQGSRIFQKLSFRTILPSAPNVHRSQPRTSTRSPSTVLPLIVHSDTPRFPQAK
jgi:hypothetical protein